MYIKLDTPPILTKNTEKKNEVFKTKNKDAQNIKIFVFITYYEFNNLD